MNHQQRLSVITFLYNSFRFRILIEKDKGERFKCFFVSFIVLSVQCYKTSCKTENLIICFQNPFFLKESILYFISYFCELGFMHMGTKSVQSGMESGGTSHNLLWKKVQNQTKKIMYMRHLVVQQRGHTPIKAVCMIP